MYRAMLREKSREDFDIAFRALTWLSFSQLPLKMRQLARAAVLERDADIDDRSLIDPSLVLEICGGFVEMDPKTEIITLAHASVRDFLRSPTMPDKSSNIYYIDPAISVPLLLESCLCYLQLPRFTRLLDPYSDEIEEVEARADIRLSDDLSAVVRKVEGDDFYVVAALSWTLYAKHSSDQTSINHILTFFKGASFRLWTLFWSQVELEDDHWLPGLLDRVQEMEVLVKSYRTGTDSIVKTWYYDIINIPFLHRITPLYIAVRLGSCPLSRHLLSMGADPDAQGGRFQYPLSLAIKQDSIALVDELLQAGANPNSRSDFRYDNPPIHQAARLHNACIIELLLRYGADLVTNGGDNTATPLVQAFTFGSLEPDSKIIRLLLGGDPASTGAVKALHIAVRRNWVKSGRLLLQLLGEESSFVVPTEIIDSAARESSAHMLKLLMEFDANLITTRRCDVSSFFSPFESACRTGNLEVLGLLAELVADQAKSRVVIKGKDITRRVQACPDPKRLMGLCVQLTDCPVFPIHLWNIAFFLGRAGNEAMSKLFQEEAERLSSVDPVPFGLGCDKCRFESRGGIWSCRKCLVLCCLECSQRMNDRVCPGEGRRGRERRRPHLECYNPLLNDWWNGIVGRIRGLDRGRSRSRSPDRERVARRPSRCRWRLLRLRELPNKKEEEEEEEEEEGQSS
jgi:hypothetical protein